MNLLIKTRAGWIGRVGGSEAPVNIQTVRELDRLLASRQLWAEPGIHPNYVCPDAGADVITIRHAGRTKTVYQTGGCGTPNLTTRLIATALREQLPP